MAFEEALISISLTAAGDLSSNQFLLHTVDANGRADLTTNASSNNPTGVLQQKPAAIDREVTLTVMGVTKIFAGETIAAGDLLCPSSVTAGRVDDADASTDTIIGVALQGGDAGELISCFIGGVFGGEVA